MALAAVSNTSPSRRRSRDVLQIAETLRRQNPRIGEDQLVELIADEIYDDRSLLLDAARFILRKASAPARTKRLTVPPRQRREAKASEDAVVKEIAGKVREVVLLDMEVEGQKLRFMKASAVAAFGGWLARVGTLAAERGGPNSLIGETVTEQDAQQLRTSA
jgi:hypothetical protein